MLMRSVPALALIAFLALSTISMLISIVPPALAETNYSLEVLNTSIAPGEYVAYKVSYYGVGPYSVYIYLYTITGGLCSAIENIAEKLGTSPLALMESVWSENKVNKAPYQAYGYTVWIYNRLERKGLTASSTATVLRLRLVDLVTSVPRALENAPTSMLNLSLPYLAIGGASSGLPKICTMVAVCSALGCHYAFKSLLVVPLVMVKPRFESYYPCTLHLDTKDRKVFIELDVWGAVGLKVVGIDITSFGKKVLELSGADLSKYLLPGSRVMPDSAGHIAMYIDASKLSLGPGLYNVTIEFGTQLPSLAGLPKYFSQAAHVGLHSYIEWYHYTSGAIYLYMPYRSPAMMELSPVVMIGGAVAYPAPGLAVTFGKYSGYISRLVIAVAGVGSRSVDIVLKPLTKFSNEYVWAKSVRPPAVVPMESPSNMTGGLYTIVLRDAVTGKVLPYNKLCSIYTLAVDPLVEVIKGSTQPTVNETTMRIVVEKGVGPIILHIYGFAKGPRNITVYTLNSTSGKPVKLIAAAKEYRFPQKITELAKTNVNGAATIYVYAPLSSKLVGGRNVLLVTDGVVNASSYGYILPTVYWKKMPKAVSGKVELPGVNLTSPVVSAIHSAYGQLVLVVEGKPVDYLGDTVYVNAFAVPPSSAINVSIAEPSGAVLYSVCTSLPCTFAVPPLPEGSYSIVAHFKLSKPVAGLAPGAWLSATARFFNETFYLVSSMVVKPKILLVKLGALHGSKHLPIQKLVKETTVVKTGPFEGLDIALVLGTGFAPNDSVEAVLLNDTVVLMNVNANSIKLWSTNELGELVSSVGVPALLVPIMQSGLYAVTIVGEKSGASEPAYMIVVDRTVEAAKMVMSAVTAMRYAVEDELRALSSEIYILSTSLTSVIEALANETGALSSSVQSLGTNLASKISELEKLYTASYANLSKALSDIESGIEALSTSVKTIQSGLGAVSTNISTIKSGLEELKSSVSELRSALAALGESISALPTKIVTPLSLEIEKASKNVTATVSRVGSELSKALLSVNSSISSSIASLGTLVKSVELALEKSIASNTSALEKLVGQGFSRVMLGMAALSSEVKSVAKTLSSVNSLLLSMNATLGTLATKAQVQSLASALSSKISELSTSISAKLSTISSRLSDLSSKVSNVQSALTKVAKASQVAELSAKVSGVSSKLGTVQGLIIATLILAIIAAVSSSIALAQLRKGRAG